MFTSFLKLAGASVSLLFWCFWTPFCVRKAAYKATRVHTPLFLSRPLSTPARGTGVLCGAFVHLFVRCLFCLSGASGPQPPPLFVKPYTPPPPSKPTTMCALLLRARVSVCEASPKPPPHLLLFIALLASLRLPYTLWPRPFACRSLERPKAGRKRRFATPFSHGSATPRARARCLLKQKKLDTNDVFSPLAPRPSSSPALHTLLCSGPISVSCTPRLPSLSQEAARIFTSCVTHMHNIHCASACARGRPANVNA
jgi:hypothetical protein